MSKGEIKNEIIDYVFKTYIQPMDKNSEGEQCSNYDWNDSKDMIEDIAEKLNLKELQHHRDTTVGLYATDKEPEKIFEEIFVNLIEEIEMDGEKTFSALDYEYYRDMFNKGIKLLMFKIK